MRFEGKSAIVVGAGRNAGRAISARLASEGANVAIVVRNNLIDAEETAHLVRAAGTKALVVRADASVPEQVMNAVKAATMAFTRLDVLCYSVGDRPEKPFLHVDRELWQRVFANNVDGAFNFAQAVLPQMVERRSGSIVFTTGLSAHTGRGIGRAHVEASKGALRSLVHGLAAEFGPFGIRVNAMAPSSIAVVRDASLYPDNVFPSDDESPERMKNIPLRRRGTPEEAAAAVAFLASDDASFITGASLHVNGGIFMN